MRRLIITFVAVFALAVPGQASATYWNWGHNYLGNSTDNGLCPNFLPHPGSVCSGWNYWDTDHMHKHAGGTISWGWVNNSQTGTFMDSGVVDFYSAPSNFGMGGYIKGTAFYEYNAASYLELEVYTV
ncbi:MAG: hypothetical protein M3540_10545 [Actinomycetota bacterium]|nr:hypothetical protein [Actinomycetota bacterium]